MSGAILRRRDRTDRPLRVDHYSAAVNRGTFFPRKVGELVDGDEPTEMNLFNVRTRFYQAGLDPAAAEEPGRPRTWLARHD